MRVATYNVNSIRAREERLIAWLISRQPDVCCLQETLQETLLETKCGDADFPFATLRALGYALASRRIARRVERA